jgi:RNA polymerase sigma-70 factor (ECF subfamily)
MTTATTKTHNPDLYVNHRPWMASNIDEAKGTGMQMMQVESVDADRMDHPMAPEDFDGIVSRYQKQIYRVLLLLVKDSDAADTLTQECFLRAFRKRSGFRGECRLSTWLVRIAINLARDHNRSRRWAFWRRLERGSRIETMPVPAGQRSQEQALIDGEAVKTVLLAVEKLPERQKSVFLLHFNEEMPLADIAEAMDLKLGTVKTHLFRATGIVRSACRKTMERNRRSGI